MTFFEILLLAVALPVDAAVCSIICGKKRLGTILKWRYALLMGSAFGFFQFMMPVLGFDCVQSLLHLIEDYDHFVKFAFFRKYSSSPKEKF